MIGYWNRPEETADVLRDHTDDGGTRRWLHTGDLGYLDEDGYVFIVDRKKDLIKTSGYQVWPREIEEVLAAHPAVAEVGVAGVPDATQGRSGQGVGRAARRAARRPRPSCARSAASSWRRTRCRRTIEFRTELPKTMVGKVLRRALQGRRVGAGWAGWAGRSDRRSRSRSSLALLAPRLRADADQLRGLRRPLRDARRTSPSRAWSPAPTESRRMDIAMMIWVLKGVDGRIAIVDSGFHRERYFTQFTVKDYVKPSEAIAPLGIKPDDVTDIFLSHMHWDHAGGIDLFPEARVWVQKDEYDYYTGDAWQSRSTHGGIDADDVLEIVKRNTEGKVSFVRGDDDTSLSGITFGIGGKHTWASQFVARADAAAHGRASRPTTCISTRTSTRTRRSRRRSTRRRTCGRRIG